MTFPSVTTTFTGPGNQGLQVGHNSGSIEAHIYAPGKCPPASAVTDAALIALLSTERPETPPQPSCFLPFRRDPDFVDRGTLLDQICEQCAAPTSRVALVGVGGVGKSQLAIEHCYRTAEQSPDTWVFWAHASNTARLEQSFREIADQVKVRGRKDPQADVFKLVHDWLRDEKNGRWLLVLDNADDAAVLSPADDGSKVSSSNGNGSALQQHLSRYLPSRRYGSVLVTSRTRRAATQVVEESDIIPIQPMHDAAAHALLCKKLGGIREEDDSIAELATTLDHMPLALVQAAAYIRERAPRCSVRQYVEECRQSDSRKTSLLNREAGQLRRDEAASNSVLITWQISFDHIRSTRQSAADLLSLMSFFDRQGIQEALLRRQSSVAAEDTSAVEANDEFEDDVLALRDYSFITVTRDAKTFEMHSLVQLATRTWLENEGQLDKWKKQFIANLCAELPTGEHENREKCQALFPHARAALAQRPKDEESLKKWALLLYKAASYAWQQGRAGEAEHMSKMSMEVRSEVCGEESAETLSSMDMVGLARKLGGKYGQAETMHRQTLARREKVLGDKHPDTLMSMNNLALVLYSQGKYEEAETMHRQTLAGCKKALGHEHPDTLMSINNLALVLGSQGKYEEAEAMHRQTLARKEKVLGHEHPDMLGSMNNLATVLYSQGKYEEAEAMHRQTLARKEKVLGHEHPDMLGSMNNLATVLDSQGKYEEAETMHRQTLARSEKVLGDEHPDTLAIMNNLAGVLDRQGKYEEAEAMYRQTLLARREKVLGDEHPDTLAIMNNLAGVLYSQGKYEEAETMHRQTLAPKEQALGDEHPSTLMSMNNLAGVLNSQGKYEEAETMHRQTLARYKKALGHEHPDTLMSMNNLALVLYSQGKYEEAETMHRQTLARREKVLGHKHPDTLTSMINLAGVLYSQGKYEEAEMMHRQELVICKKVLGHEHPDTLTSMNNLALVLYSQGKYEEAETMYRQTLARSEKVLGHEHPDTLTSVYCLAHLLAHRYRYEESLVLYDRASAGYEAVLGKDDPTTRACRQHYADALAKQEQGPPVISTTTADGSASARTGKGKRSKLLRGLAKIGIRSSQLSAR
ncbi:TPR domain protein [Paraphoma chrysanthemicola]|nr:TPR domain protein [Paraphoma chrysanthemicola]